MSQITKTSFSRVNSDRLIESGRMQPCDKSQSSVRLLKLALAIPPVRAMQRRVCCEPAQVQRAYMAHVIQLVSNLG